MDHALDSACCSKALLTWGKPVISTKLQSYLLDAREEHRCSVFAGTAASWYASTAGGRVPVPGSTTHSRATMSCFGLCFTQESSRQPKKRYKELVPAVFPDKPIAWDAAIDAAIARRISNVQDYVEANVQRCPDVSRKLRGRFSKELGDTRGLGHCKVGRSPALTTVLSRTLAAHETGCGSQSIFL